MRQFRSLFILKLSLIIVSFLFIGGCSTVNQPTTPSSSTTNKTNNAAWQQRKAVLARKNTWNLKSKIGLSYQEEYWQFGLNWAQQASGQYTMQINNPLTGAVVAKLLQNRQGATLLANDGKTYRSRNAEQLLQAQSGLKMPLDGMQHWVKGISAPQYKVDKLVLDNYGRPRFIQQAGWLIQYSAYQGNTSTALPTKIILKRAKDNVNVKLIAKQWQGI